MKKRVTSEIMLALLLSVSMLAFNVVTGQSVVTIGIGAYWDSSLTNPVTSVDWGILQPGSAEDVIVYIRNEGSVPVTLSMASSNWNPPEAVGFFSLNWNYAGGVLEPSNVVPMTFTLLVSSSIEGIHHFSFDCVLFAHDGYSATSLAIAEYGSITRTWIVDDDGSADFKTIQEALDAASLGDTVFVKSGIYYENLYTEESLSLVGENWQSTIIDGKNGFCAVGMSSDVALLSGFTIRNSYTGICLGIGRGQSSNNLIFGNNVVNNDIGIEVTYSSNHRIFGNIVKNNSIFGIELGKGSNYNSVFENTVETSKRVGIRFEDSEDNRVFHNNLVGNTVQASSGSFNVWDDGFPSGGNYWSDYVESDTDGDGVGDTPYIIDANNRDRYPLMKPWSASTMVKTVIRTIKFWDLPKGTETSLTSKLEGALKFSNAGKEDVAVHRLTAFVNQVQALDKKLTSEQADYLMAEAQRIIDLVEEQPS